MKKNFSKICYFRKMGYKNIRKKIKTRALPKDNQFKQHTTPVAKILGTVQVLQCFQNAYTTKTSQYFNF